MLEKNIKRYLDMITQVYYQQNHKMYKSTLYNSLGISIKTLESDIEKVNLIFNKELIIQEDNHIVLKLEISEGLKPIYKGILRTSTVVSYFYEVSMRHVTLPEIYNELYLSESMEYRIRKAWNHYFLSKNYQAEFVYNSDTKKIDLIGNEKTIRSLMRYMLYEYVFEDLYDNFQYNDILSLMQLVLKKNKIVMNYVATDFIAASLYISVVRISQGYLHGVTAEFSLKLVKRLLLKDPQILASARQVFNGDVSDQILADLFGDKLIDLMKLIGINSKNIFANRNKKLTSFVSTYASMKYHNDIHLKKNELQLLQVILDFSDTQVSSFVYSPHQLYWEWVATEEDKKLFCGLLDSYGLTSDLSSKDKKKEFFFVLNNMLNFDNLEKSVNYTKFLIVSRYPTYYQNRVERTLHDRYHAFIDLTIYKKSINALDEQLLKNYDFVISELTFPLYSEKHVYFPEVLCEEFITNLDNLIFHL